MLVRLIFCFMVCKTFHRNWWYTSLATAMFNNLGRFFGFFLFNWYFFVGLTVANFQNVCHDKKRLACHTIVTDLLATPGAFSFWCMCVGIMTGTFCVSNLIFGMVRTMDSSFRVMEITHFQITGNNNYYFTTVQEL